MKKVIKEYRLFLSYPRDMRVLIVTNLVYGIVMPVIEMFVSAYVMRQSNDPKMVVTYQLAIYSAVPLTFLVNGWLLRLVNIKRLYAVGMLLSGVSMTIMMRLPDLNLVGLGLAGLLMGVASSLYWANRDFLALASTTDENRNYYYGLETFFATNTNIVVPMAVGTFIGWYGGEQVEKVLGAYRIVTGLVFVLAMMASVLVQKGGFRNPPATRFIYLRYHWIWNRMQVMSIIKGIGDGYLVTAPAMLVMTLVGKEGSLGTLLSAGGVISAVMLYILGRTTKPKHRIWLMTIGMSVFLLGALANAILFSAAGVLVFMVLFVLSRPLTDIAAYPIYLLAIDTAAAAEKRNQYSHVMSREFACYIGRAGGCLLFILLAYGISNQFALRYALLMVALLQLLAIPVAQTIIRGCDAYWRGVAASTAGTVPLSDESPATISK